MCANNNFDSKLQFNKCSECLDVWTGRIADDHPGGQMNDLRTILDHFFARIFYVATRTPIAGCKSDQFDIRVSIDTESTFLISHCSEAFPSRAAAVAVTDDYANPGF